VVRLKPCYRTLLCFVRLRVQAMEQKPQIQERNRKPEGPLESTVLHIHSATLQTLWATSIGTPALAEWYSFPWILGSLHWAFRGIVGMDLQQFEVLLPSVGVPGIRGWHLPGLYIPLRRSFWSCGVRLASTRASSAILSTSTANSATTEN
jgi:hypothetical protein